MSDAASKSPDIAQSLLNSQLMRLSAVLQLEQRARKATSKELDFIIVNETTAAVPYQQAALWHGKTVAAVSGVAKGDTASPYYQWLVQLFSALERDDKAATFHAVNPADFSDAIAKEWAQWFPVGALWCPLVFPDGTLAGGVLLGRNQPWQEGERQLLEVLCGSYAQCLALNSLHPSLPLYRRLWPSRPKRVGLISLVILCIAFLPLRVSVLAPADIIPLDPASVRAPFDGVIASVDVKPNQPVHAGQTLLSFDTAELKARQQVASKALDMAHAEYTSAAQEALDDAQAKSKLASLQSRIEQQQAELDYDESLLKQAVLVSTIDGIAVFDDPVALIGKPVAQGERVMLVASNNSPLVEIQVPVADIITFQPGAEVLFFSNIEPDRPVRAKLEFASYASRMTADGILSYHFRARIEDPTYALRLGLKGTAKIYGDRRPLALWLLRRPMALVRQWLAF